MFNNLPYFHVTNNFVFDIMHDILEGVVPDFMVHFLNRCISKKYFSLDSFNYRLESFNYGRHYKNTKPSLIKHSHLKSDNKIGQNSAQNLCLTLFLGLMIGDRVPDDEDVWKLYILLHEIVVILLADKITKGGIIYLQCLISEYCFSYKTCFSKKLKPKHHHLLHYGAAIEAIGPLKQYWSMTFESKHKFFKTTAHAIGNFKNISKSLA